MGTISVIETTVDTQTSTASDEGDFVDVVETETLVVDKEYYVICSASVEASNSTELFEWRLYDYTNGEVLEDSTTIREQAQSGVPQSYYYVGHFTVGAARTLAFQQKGYAEGSDEGYLPARTNFLSMLLLDMSDLSAKDYFFANLVSGDVDSGTFRDRVTHTVTGVDEGDTWLVFGWIASWVNKVSASIESKIVCDADSNDGPLTRFEGEHLDEELQWWTCRSYTMTDLASSSVEWKMQARSTDSPHSYTRNSTLFGIRLNALADTYQTHVRIPASPTDTDFFELASNSFTPSVTGKVIVAACSLYDGGGTNRKGGQRIQKDGTTIPNTQPDSEKFVNTNDATDQLPLSYITVFDGIADSAAQIDYDVISSIGTSAVAFDDYTLAIFGTTTAAPPDPIMFGAVENQVFVAGQQAGETFSAGQQAGETFSAGKQESETYSAGQQAGEITG